MINSWPQIQVPIEKLGRYGSETTYVFVGKLNTSCAEIRNHLKNLRYQSGNYFVKNPKGQRIFLINVP